MSYLLDKSYTPPGEQHHVLVCWYDPDWPEDEDYHWQVWCPFGESHVLVSDVATCEDVWLGQSGLRQPTGAVGTGKVMFSQQFERFGWPAEMGHEVEGYCTMEPFIRAIYKWRTEGAILEAQVIGTSGCYIDYEISQVGVVDLLADSTDYDISGPGAYEVELWTDGYGESYTSGLEIRLGPVHPDVLAEIGWPLESSADFTCLTPVHVAQD